MTDFGTLVTLLQSYGLFQQQAEELRIIQQQMGEDELVISVVGQFKRGKSSLLNAMLGQPLLPVAITPLTAVVTELRAHEEQRARVCFRDGTSRSIVPEELSLYCGEKENPHNQKKVQSVKLWTPKQPFGAGTVLVDTPGVGSTNQDNTRETMNYLIHSDAVIFVLSVDSPINETELQFLREIRQYAPNLWIVVNKADLVDEGELREFLDYCTGVLTRELSSPAVLCPVSARTGAGVQELTERLMQELESSRSRLREDSARQKLSLVLGQLRALLSVAEQAASAPRAELQTKRKRLWEQRQSLSAYGETVQVLARHHTERLVQDIGQELKNGLNELCRGMERRDKELDRSLEELGRKEFRCAYQKGMEAYLKMELEALNDKGLALLNSGFGEVTAMLTTHADETEETLARVLKEEFQVDYPLSRETFSVSEQEDFYLRVELQRMPRLSLEMRDRLSPQQSAKERFRKRCLACGEETLKCNVSNMRYNYGYKMQESLRPLCRKLEERIRRVDGELGRLIDLLDERLESAEQERQEKTEAFARIREEVEKLSCYGPDVS